MCGCGFRFVQYGLTWARLGNWVRKIFLKIKLIFILFSQNKSLQFGSKNTQIGRLFTAGQRYAGAGLVPISIIEPAFIYKTGLAN